ncbi:MAG TPA: hypothetical protein VNG31_05390 [Candidatus Baltobacteraceae bacterium]|nr:hypothetical protein [Candidatus Baltobacteraceae bacterium]
MELQRALSDLAEVRDRLAHVQRFEGYSGPAAVASGIVALVAGYAQLRLVPHPQNPGAFRTYLLIWMLCLAVALALNYGAVAVWLIRNRGPGAQSRFRTAALSIAPSIVLGGALSVALLHHGTYALLPGTWFAFYAIGLFASRTVIPEAALAIMAGFALLAVLFLATPLEGEALSWWVVPLGFGIGQIGIGCLLWRSRTQ